MRKWGVQMDVGGGGGGGGQKQKRSQLGFTSEFYNLSIPTTNAD